MMLPRPPPEPSSCPRGRQGRSRWQTSAALPAASSDRTRPRCRPRPAAPHGAAGRTPRPRRCPGAPASAGGGGRIQGGGEGEEAGRGGGRGMRR
eukprot:405540-Hanusia_phi.AAC.7